MSKVEILSSQDVFYIVTWEYDSSVIGLRPKKNGGWVEELFVTKSKHAFDTFLSTLKATPVPASFRNVRGFVMKAEPV